MMVVNILWIAMVLAVGVSACTETKTPQEKTTDEQATLQTENENRMNNVISIVEIPATDFARAVSFYQTVLGVRIEEMEMDGNQMGVVPNDPGTVNLVIVKGPDYTPTSDGAVLYINAGHDLQTSLDKVSQSGGQVLVPKTLISPEMGYFALFLDTEGNKLGLHSAH
jgi:predicted enzyme related to lactoylglutathione lyase